jgi:type IV pilus assembly protein PilP
MRMLLSKASKIVTLILLISCLLWSCGDQKEKTKPPVISKRISVQSKPMPKDKTVEKQAKKSTGNVEETGAGEQEASIDKRLFDPEKLINPFLPLFRAEKEQQPAEQTSKRKRKKRIPQTPLERISLDQLKLVAIIRAPSGNRALMEDGTGKGYIVKKGTYIGLNSGVVTKINAESLIVEEEIENLMGDYVLQNTEIKLRKPAGE